MRQFWANLADKLVHFPTSLLANQVEVSIAPVK